MHLHSVTGGTCLGALKVPATIRETRSKASEDVITSHLSEWLESQRQKTGRAARMWRKGNPRALLVGIETGTAPEENSTQVPQKLTLELPQDSATRF